MNSKILLSVGLLLTGIGVGFLWDTGGAKSGSDAAMALAEENNQLLVSIEERMGRASFRHTFSQSDECTQWSGLLPPLKQAIEESVQSAVALSGSGAGHMPSVPSSRPPTQEQAALYESVKQRIYAYASSGEPLLDAMGKDRDFQQLSTSQKKRLAREVVQRFNQGEITMTQLRGR